MCQVVKYLCSAFFFLFFFFLAVCFGGRVRIVDADFDKPPLILITKKGSKVCIDPHSSALETDTMLYYVCV